MEISSKTTDIIYGYVRKDLEPSILDVIWRVGASLLIGGLLSMFFCGQFGIGFSTMAKGWNHAVHAHMGAVQCAIVCGVAFSVVPVFILRFLSSGVLFRKIIRHYGFAQGGLILVAGSAMYFGGSFMNELANIGIWSLSAFIGFKLIGLIVDEASQLLLSPSEI